MGREPELIQGAIEIDVAGEQIWLLPQRALWWRARRTLLVADVHLGKCQAYRASGVPIPGAVLDADLASLSALIAQTRAERLIVLGDLIHARVGLSPEVVQRVAIWRAQNPLPFELVPGNHDGDASRLPDTWAIVLREEVSPEAPFVLRHTPAEDPRGYVLCGHLHPAVHIGPMRLPCFHFGARIGILPALSVFTGTALVQPDPADRVYLVAPDRVTPAPRRPQRGRSRRTLPA
ncbi:MAG: ligase-associated DNA damage response endonuclease PdeM [Phycisphaerales bacterium JB039]